MSSKVIYARAGDRWTKLGSALWLYRGEHAFVFTSKAHGLNDAPDLASGRNKAETDLTTPEAHAQLREWGYEIGGDESQPLTESRVREIVEEVLAAKAKPTPEPDWLARCEIVPIMLDEGVFGYMLRTKDKAFYFTFSKEWVRLAPGCNARVFIDYEAASAALAKAPPPPDVSPEPDWRGLLDAVVNARSHTEQDMALEKAAKALASARTNLAAKGGK